MTFPTPPALDRLRLRARYELRRRTAGPRRRLRSWVIPSRPAATRHPNPSKARAARALRAYAGRPTAPPSPSTPRERLESAVRSLRYRARRQPLEVLRHPLNAVRYVVQAAELVALVKVCERRGHDDTHPTSCPTVLPCVYCRRCGRTAHQEAPPLPMVPPSRTELDGLRHEREWVLTRYGLGREYARVMAYVQEVAAGYGLDNLNAHRLVRQRLDAGEWTP